MVEVPVTLEVESWLMCGKAGLKVRSGGCCFSLIVLVFFRLISICETLIKFPHGKDGTPKAINQQKGAETQYCRRSKSTRCRQSSSGV